ncbi:type I restriction-modification system subunit M N-terminal domain-containing protein [Acuticoccus sp. 2012]|uniref:Type I restriction-modification system subunit M N-terminal domain-containing protein n=1 Tax=Acuticoccus mangrovi TaxID=2796142 RepID=A0A934IN72_9HYPH|nr:type I restriction-modification system subunit M N-terminal domain-containing protein [Acuticoccus mangrovi]
MRVSIERTLFQAADQMRGAMDVGEFKHVALAMLFLRYVSAVFELQRQKLEAEEFADPEDPEGYRAENVLWVPEPARWSHLAAIAKSPEIGVEIDNAMRAIETANPSLKDALPTVSGRESLDRGIVSGLIDLFTNMPIEGKRGLGPRGRSHCCPFPRPLRQRQPPGWVNALVPS